MTKDEVLTAAAPVLAALLREEAERERAERVSTDAHAEPEKDAA